MSLKKSNTLRKDGLGPYEGRPDRASRQCFDDRPTIATCDRAAEADIALDNISDTCCTMVTIAHRCQRRNIKVSVSCSHPLTQTLSPRNELTCFRTYRLTEWSQKKWSRWNLWYLGRPGETHYYWVQPATCWWTVPKEFSDDRRQLSCPISY